MLLKMLFYDFHFEGYFLIKASNAINDINSKNE